MLSILFEIHVDILYSLMSHRHFRSYVPVFGCSLKSRKGGEHAEMGVHKVVRIDNSIP